MTKVKHLETSQMNLIPKFKASSAEKNASEGHIWGTVSTDTPGEEQSVPGEFAFSYGFHDIIGPWWKDIQT